MRTPPLLLTTVAVASLSGTVVAGAAEIHVRGAAELLRAAGGAGPGDVIVVGGGPLSGVALSGLRGREGAPITLRGASAERPAEFRGGNVGLQLSACEFVTLRFLDVRGARGNGINIDDGGDKARPARGIRVEDCLVADIGPRGNHDALKLSGVDDFAVLRCRFEGWGGSGIDMVGCHDGVVEACAFIGKGGFSQSNGVQMKGGSARVSLRSCYFEGAGQRGVNIGGSTGLDYFRPRAGDCEAEAIEVAGNRFVGSLAPIAWVGSKGGRVHHNTFYLPEKWVLRILQENTAPGFEPAAGGSFEDNVIVFDRRVAVFANVGGGTAPETFRFRGNAWFEVGRGAGGRRPDLPSPEEAGVYGVDPELEAADGPAMRVTSPAPELRGKGADGYRP